MEEYVWCLALNLADKHPVCVLCEKVEDDTPFGVEVVEMPSSYRSISAFSKKVEAWLQSHPKSMRIVHSHQSLGPADLFTFHSTPHGWGEGHKWLKRLSFGWWRNQYMYRRAMTLGNFSVIVPVSATVSEQVRTTYPYVSDRLRAPISPGVKQLDDLNKLPDAPIIGFMGREWDRKGLRHVVAIFREIMGFYPDARLVVAGMPPGEVEGMIAGLERQVDLLGWVEDKGDFYDRIRLLVHPARLEAFGMVVTEAMARGIPVLVSDQTGAADEVDDSRGRVLSLDVSMKEWVDSTQDLLKRSDFVPEPYRRSWIQVAEEYIEVYKTLPPGSFQR